MAWSFGSMPKTESVKALGSAMGRQVLVFNCDEGIDFKAMGRIFVGIVKCGAWGCFDEFNRLKVDQLSAISQLIQVIQEALKNSPSHYENMVDPRYRKVGVGAVERNGRIYLVQVFVG